MNARKAIWIVVVVVAGTLAMAQSTPSGSQQPPASTPDQQPQGTANPDPRLDQPLQPLQPIQPASGDSSSVNRPAAPSSEPTLSPDTTPLNSMQDLTLGTTRGGGGGGGRNFFNPSFRMSQFGSVTTGLPQDSTGVTNLSGRIQLEHDWRRSSMSLDYVGGGSIFDTNSDFNSTFHQLSFASAWHLTRWSFNLSDEASYLPLSSFGFNGIAGLEPGAGIGNIGGGYIPNQSIIGADETRVSNTATVGTQYQLSPRSMLHFGASYGVLRFQGGGLINSDTDSFTGGYDRNYGRNTIGLNYTATLLRFGGSDRNIDTHTVQLSYGRRITGRLALQLSAGPEYRQIDDPATGSGHGWSVDARSALMYQMGRFNMGMSFTRNSTAGAGILAGSTADTVQGNIGRSFGRDWSLTGDFGYAHNSTLQVTAAPNTSFDTFFAGCNLQRNIGRQASIYLSYNLQHQMSSIPVCLGCGDSLNRHVFGMGFEWHARPISLGY